MSDIVKLRGNVLNSHLASRRQRRTDVEVEDDDTLFDLFDVETSNNKVKTLVLIPKVRTEIQFKKCANEWLPHLIRASTPREDSDVTPDDISQQIEQQQVRRPKLDESYVDKKQWSDTSWANQISEIRPIILPLVIVPRMTCPADMETN
jgi:hypothetical protein